MSNISSAFGSPPMSGFTSTPGGSSAPVNAGAVQSTSEARKRSGLIPGRIGGRFDARKVLRQDLVRAAEDAEYTGITMSVEDRSRFIRDHEGKPVSMVLVCMHDNCAGKRWNDFESMIVAHPPFEVMTRTGEAHVWCFLSEELRGRKARAVYATGDEKRKLAMLHDAMQQPPVGNIATGSGLIGLLSDEQWASR
jgi:hypothetical protein